MCDEPRLIGDPKTITITGYLLMWSTRYNQPVFLIGSWGSVLPIFSTSEKLHEAVAWMEPEGTWSIKQIDDGPDFIDSVRGVLVVADPYLHGGNVRWTGIFPYEEVN